MLNQLGHCQTTARLSCCQTTAQISHCQTTAQVSHCQTTVQLFHCQTIAELGHCQTTARLGQCQTTGVRSLSYPFTRHSYVTVKPLLWSILPLTTPGSQETGRRGTQIWTTYLDPHIQGWGWLAAIVSPWSDKNVFFHDWQLIDDFFIKLYWKGRQSDNNLREG